MGDKSKIQWTEATYNPWHGCKKVSAGCKYCYMYRDKEKYGQDPTVVVRSQPSTFNMPLKLKEPTIIFTCSWSDFFIEDADPWRAEAWAIIKVTPQHTYQILTKRPERILEHLPADWGTGYPNVWIGVSVEDQKAADLRIPLLFNVPAVVRFLSCEPLLGPVDLVQWLHDSTCDIKQGVCTCNEPFEHIIDWIIIGGESGNDNGEYLYRPCDTAWIQSIITQSLPRAVPVFVKQMGTYISKQLKLKDRHGGKAEEWPVQLQIREFPET